MSKAMKAKLTAKSGAISNTSRRPRPPRRHQCRTTSTAGSVTTMFLAKRPTTNSASTKPYRRHMRSAPAPFGESSKKGSPSQQAAQIEQMREHVLAFDGPRNGFHMQRMDGEHRGDEPRARHRQPRQDAPQQHAIGGVQKDVDDVVAVRVVAPQLVLQPEREVGERAIVRLVQFEGREPDAREASPIPQRRFVKNELPVVPDEAAPQHHRQVAGQRQQHQRRNAPTPAAATGFGQAAAQVRFAVFAAWRPVRL